MSEKRRFHLEIVTPDRQFFIGEAQSLIFPSIDGSVGVEGGHEPAATALEPGILQYQVDGQWQSAVVSQGFVEVMPERVMVLTSTAERPEEIDEKRAQAALERAEERLRQKQSMRDYYRTKAALARAMARLKAKRRY